MQNRAAACEGHTRADATADANCGPLRGEFAASLKPQIQNWMGLPGSLGYYSDSGRSLRRARTMRTCGTRVAGLRRPQAAARRSLRDRFRIVEGTQLPVRGEMFANKIGPSGPCGPQPPAAEARSSPTSLACPAGCCPKTNWHWVQQFIFNSSFFILNLRFQRNRRSPQPPPGGGLLLSVASPSARRRACLGLESALKRPSGPQPPGSEGPQLTSALASLVRALRRLQPTTQQK